MPATSLIDESAVYGRQVAAFRKKLSLLCSLLQPEKEEESEVLALILLIKYIMKVNRMLSIDTIYYCLFRQFSQATSRRPDPSRRLGGWPGCPLRGRLVNAEEASSANAIGLRREEAVAWELFSPAQRFLIVAVIGVAVSESKKNGIIIQLKESVELRDQVLSSMQQKLDSLCDQLSNINNQAGTKANASLNSKTVEPPDAFGCDKIKFVGCGCWHCDQHQDLLAGLMENSFCQSL
ncbi:hypothetical protein OIU84_023466 [Salix udensis]|uniref:Uncharacterized protein n=1 Tax=Salix udensis TaxID=889485 RepID=A0AAD6PF28_9ROSI|nr:hypothetical protein OIU84_023466 [Salix udensis]